MDQWKEQQGKGRGNGEDAETEGARANAGVIIRVEQGQKGEAAAAGRGREPSDDDEKSGRAGADDEAKTAASKLNIKKLMNGTKELGKGEGGKGRITIYQYIHYLPPHSHPQNAAQISVGNSARRLAANVSPVAIGRPSPS
jgi:hypothetical protein